MVPNHFGEQVNGGTPGAVAAGFKAFPDNGLASDQAFARIGAVADNSQDIQVGTRGVWKRFSHAIMRGTASAESTSRRTGIKT